jgi:hypothetical protein
VFAASTNTREEAEMQRAMAASLQSDADRSARYSAARAAMRQHALDRQLGLSVVEVRADGRCLYGALAVALQHVGLVPLVVADSTRLVRNAVIDHTDRMCIEDLEELESRQVRDSLFNTSLCEHARRSWATPCQRRARCSEITTCCAVLMQLTHSGALRDTLRCARSLMRIVRARLDRVTI